MKLHALILGAAAALGIAGAVWSQAISIPQVTSIGPNDLFHVIPNGAPAANNVYASGALLSGTFGGYGDNFLIGGDPGQNLFQRSLAAAAIFGARQALVLESDGQ